MALALPWLILGAAVAVVLAVVVGLVVGRRAGRADASGEAVARAERLRAMPSVAAAVRRRTAGLAAVLAIACVAALAAGVVAARPMSSKTVHPVSTSRDIMLCLDVSEIGRAHV